MATIDIRESGKYNITQIDFANPGECAYFLNDRDSNLYIESNSSVIPINYKDIPNLIKALQKAQEL